MKHIFILILTILLLCSLMSGCINASAGEPTPTSAPADTGPTSAPTDIAPTEATEALLPSEVIPEGSSPLMNPDLPVETVPQRNDDSDYQLPPGETPTLEHEIS